ncbi:MAG: hypothetical protein K8S24_11880 [Candidatus Aegiribacteria sp.]|nr:hypothetical protein [Candidatus Aegiribacteria sp.]
MVRYILVALAVFSIGARAQNYGFSIPRFHCTATVNHDNSLEIDYEIEFACAAGCHPIDIIDIGFPTEDYKLESIEASVDGSPSKRIYPSTFIDNGVEVHLGNSTIYPGANAVFRLTGISSNMVFRDTEDDGHASVEFSPTWFDDSFLRGNSEFTLVMVFPPGALPGSVRYHEVPFTSSSVDSSGRVRYVWEARRKVSESFMVGVSFPAHLVAGPLAERPAPPILSPQAIGLLITICIVSIFFGLFIWLVIRAVRNAKKRRVSYLPPAIGVEGSGLRRGLTAPFAALLLEERLEKVFVLILFGLLRKGVLQLSGSGADASVIKTGSKEGLRSYEKAIIDILPDPDDQKYPPVDAVKKVFIDMIDELKEKMEGFDIEETREYYRSIISNAWQMVREAGSPDKAALILADRFGWLFVDDHFNSMVNDLPTVTSTAYPVWFRSIVLHTNSFSGGASITEICSSLAGTLEGAAGRAVSSLTKLSSIVTSVTNPIPVSRSYSGSSGGSSCACACACAGCACACAGGGR